MIAVFQLRVPSIHKTPTLTIDRVNTQSPINATKKEYSDPVKLLFPIHNQAINTGKDLNHIIQNGFFIYIEFKIKYLIYPDMVRDFFVKVIETEKWAQNLMSKSFVYQNNANCIWLTSC